MFKKFAAVFIKNVKQRRISLNSKERISGVYSKSETELDCNCKELSKKL